MGVEGRVGFHARVAARVLAMVERELSLGPAQHADAVARRAALLGITGSFRDLDVELARRIRAGELDHERDSVLAVVRASVRDKLLVGNPDHLAAS